MNIALNRLEGLIIEKDEYNIQVEKTISQNVENFPDIYGSILYPYNEIELGVSFREGTKHNVNIYKLLEKLRFQEDFGNIAFKNMEKVPVICYLFPSSEAEIKVPPDVKLLKMFDVFYQRVNFNFQAIAIAFSTACWMVKDCCVTSTEFYQFNYFNTYRVRNKIENIYTLSNGETSSLHFDREEINRAIELTPKMYKYMLQKKESSIKISEKIEELYTMESAGGNATLNIEGMLNPENSSFCRALVFLQRARKSGYLVEKIEKYCSVLECLFAIQKKHKVNIKNITSAYIGNDIDESTIRNDMHDAFGIRSDFSHGDYIEFLKDHSEEQLKELSQRIDGYVRRVLRKIFEEPDKNYTLKTRNEVRNYFDRIAKEKYPNDYKN